MKDWFWGLFGWYRISRYSRTLWVKIPYGESIPKWADEWLWAGTEHEEPSRLYYKEWHYE